MQLPASNQLSVAQEPQVMSEFVAIVFQEAVFAELAVMLQRYSQQIAV